MSSAPVLGRFFCSVVLDLVVVSVVLVVFLAVSLDLVVFSLLLETGAGFSLLASLLVLVESCGSLPSSREI